MKYIFNFLFLKKGSSLRCYSDYSSLREATRCELRKGFRSCYIKYDKGDIKSNIYFISKFVFLVGKIMGRGCSTKIQMFGTMCENHVMNGIGEEKICYCSSALCNTSTSSKVKVCGIIVIIVILICLFVLWNERKGKLCPGSFELNLQHVSALICCSIKIMQSRHIRHQETLTMRMLAESRRLLLLILRNVLTSLFVYPSHTLPITNSIQSDKMSQKNINIWRIVFSKFWLFRKILYHHDSSQKPS